MVISIVLDLRNADQSRLTADEYVSLLFSSFKAGKDNLVSSHLFKAENMESACISPLTTKPMIGRFMISNQVIKLMKSGSQ